MFALRHGEAHLAQFGAEVGGVVGQSVAQGGGGLQQIERLERGGAHGRGHGVGKQVGAGLLPEQVYDRLARRRVAAGGAAQRLAERAGEYVHAALHMGVFRRAAPVRAHEAHGVAVVHHQKRAVFLGQIADGGQVGDDAVHGKHAVGGDELDARAGGLFQPGAQIGHVVVLVAQALGLAQAHAVDDRGVVEFVGNDRVLRPQKRFKQAAVGVETAGIEDGVLHAEETGQPRFQFAVQPLRAADKAHAGKAKAPAVVACLGGGDQFRAVGQPQIVVGAEVQNAVCLRGVDARALRGGDNALVLVGARLADGGKFRLVKAQGVLHGSFLQSRMTLPLFPLFMAAKPFSNSV